MKATELMIGDWVKDVSPNGVFFYKHIDHSDIDHCFYGRATYAPIPLTAEMLEKNGWLTYCGHGANFLATKSDWNLTIVQKKIGNTYLRIGHNWICDINYVHELQHALRLCGLNELADNFKI